jgi:hypothetical protein
MVDFFVFCTHVNQVAPAERWPHLQYVGMGKHHSKPLNHPDSKSFNQLEAEVSVLVGALLGSVTSCSAWWRRRWRYTAESRADGGSGVVVGACKCAWVSGGGGYGGGGGGGGASSVVVVDVALSVVVWWVEGCWWK